MDMAADAGSPLLGSYVVCVEFNPDVPRQVVTQAGQHELSTITFSPGGALVESNLVDVRSHAGSWRHLGGDRYEYVLVEIMPGPSPAGPAVWIVVPHAFFRVTVDESGAVTGFSQSMDGSDGFSPNYVCVSGYSPADGKMLGPPVTVAHVSRVSGVRITAGYRGPERLPAPVYLPGSLGQ